MAPHHNVSASAPVVYTAELISLRWLSDKTFEVTLTRPDGFQFQAGQSICLLHGGLERHYSIISAPVDTRIELCIRHIPDGHLTPVLAGAETGSQIRFTGPHGYFTLRPSPRAALFVATGTGIAPFVSMTAGGAAGVHLLHGVRNERDLYYADKLRRRVDRYTPCLSEPSSTPMPENAFCGLVTDYIATHLPPSEYDFYLSGNQKMIRDVTHLVDERFSGSYIFTEIFY